MFSKRVIIGSVVFVHTFAKRSVAALLVGAYLSLLTALKSSLTKSIPLVIPTTVMAEITSSSLNLVLQGVKGGWQ